MFNASPFGPIFDELTRAHKALHWVVGFFFFIKEPLDQANAYMLHNSDPSQQPL